MTPNREFNGLSGTKRVLQALQASRQAPSIACKRAAISPVIREPTIPPQRNQRCANDRERGIVCLNM